MTVFHLVSEKSFSPIFSKYMDPESPHTFIQHFMCCLSHNTNLLFATFDTVDVIIINYQTFIYRYALTQNKPFLNNGRSETS